MPPLRSVSQFCLPQRVAWARDVPGHRLAVGRGIWDQVSIWASAHSVWEVPMQKKQGRPPCLAQTVINGPSFPRQEHWSREDQGSLSQRRLSITGQEGATAPFLWPSDHGAPGHQPKPLNAHHAWVSLEMAEALKRNAQPLSSAPKPQVSF